MAFSDQYRLLHYQCERKRESRPLYPQHFRINPMTSLPFLGKCSKTLIHSFTIPFSNMFLFLFKVLSMSGKIRIEPTYTRWFEISSRDSLKHPSHVCAIIVLDLFDGMHAPSYSLVIESHTQDSF